MRYDIKPDHHIKAKRGYLAAFYIELFLTLQAGMVLFHFSSNETWRNVLAIVGGGLCLSFATKLKRWGHMAKTFTRLGKQIAIAVKAGGPEPENNPTLRSVIATCKRENMPKDNIERAIKNAMGKDQSDYKGMTYEGYGPHGVAVFVDTLTDNTTRTVADVRSVFNKFGGNLGTTGSLAFLFDHKCVFTFKKKDGVDMEELILDLIDYNVEDEFDEDPEEGTITIYGDPKSYAAIQKHLEECGFEDVGGDFTYIPNDLKDVTDEQRETIDKMVERLEEFDDVQTVYTNMRPSEE